MRDHEEIEMVSGDDWVYQAAIVDGSCNPVNLTGSTIAYAFINEDGTLNESVSGNVTLIITNAIGGFIQVSVPRNVTAPLGACSCRDAIRELTSGNDEETIWEGPIIVLENPFSP